MGGRVGKEGGREGCHLEEGAGGEGDGAVEAQRDAVVNSHHSLEEAVIRLQLQQLFTHLQLCGGRDTPTMAWVASSVYYLCLFHCAEVKCLPRKNNNSE